ncbi:hypothetical protein [Actinoplanes teichomyceticus]|uniref:Uncharacterized protein n=1 Tax=Actinoplanes teichomyceticus TaxID=1867 RepID=A0A561VMX7_ACTTI|nr:hypothetical protein [Actinoplanes teichomyceticus]TWG12950.1 hypothetical protein FHX34_105818 [Actinoplanes teichomyceticus]GIF16962.1 hypothetical protein Ate01nite_69940 [Actinoplanes teichomyceticus]
MGAEMLAAARAEALFVSTASVTDHLTRPEVTELIRTAVRAHHGTRGCAAEVAARYGEYPEVAQPRMRWALDTVHMLYPAHRADRPATVTHDLAA